MKLWFLAALALVARASSGDKRQTTAPPCIPQDIVFMIDSSSYVGVDHFQQQLDFIKQNLRYYNLNPSCTRVGITTYSSGVYNQFYLNGYSTQQQLFNAIDGIKYQAGGSNTGDAINYVSTNAYTSTNGGRTGVPHYGILVTGSTSGNPSMTVGAANLAHQNGMNLYTVGVGSGVNQGELSGIASYEKNQFYAQSYNSLNTLAQPLATRINGAVTPQTMSNLGATSSCLQQADIVFMVDGSGSIGSANFQKLENFVKGIVAKLDVGANKVHVGLMQFSNYPKQEFPLGMYNNRADVMTGVDQVHYMGGGTNTGDAIKYMRENMFSTTAGARPSVPRIGVVITDGKSSNPTLTASQANLARGDNIGLLAIGVGSGVDANELHAIADDPDAQNTFQVNNYDQLSSIATQIVNRACQVQATAAPVSSTGLSNNQGPETCVDHIADCKNYGQSVCSGSYFGWAKDNCPRYCGFCIPVYTTAPPPCVDKLSNCNEFEPNSCVGQFEQWAKDNCMKYCGYCSVSSQSVGFYGKCYYKGKTYEQGANWDDGCDYSCTCQDGATGKYQCFNKCPVYNNLPATCTLVKSETECCLQPVCDFNPKITTFESTSHGSTPDGVDVCVYKNHQYYQGQTWEDGCDYSCTCTNSKMGVYSCQTLCPDYTNVPSFCHMSRQPGECCNKPVCEFKTQQGSFTGMGTISGHGTGISPTAPPACTDVLPDCDRYGNNACINFKPWARDNCAKTCQLCVDNAPNPDPTDVCIYNGQAFHQGESWQQGCDTICTCENAVYGYYRCVNTCPSYTNIPSTCQQVKKAGDCCTSIQCQPGTGNFVSSTGNLNTIGGGGLIVPSTGGVTPTLPSGAIPQPGTGGTGVTPPSLSGCLYKGNLYIQGQTWDDGCQYSCECQDASSGQYKCRAKCPMFPNLPSECHLQVDSTDPCCQKPVCQFTGTPVPVLPVFGQTTTGHNVVAPPSPSQLYQGTQTIHLSFTVPGATPAPPTAPTGSVGGIGHCEYKGQTYLQGQTWEDGCTYNCVCEDAKIGFYRCREKCQNYGQLPKQCHLVQDPSNVCCKIPNCTFVGQNNSFIVTATPPSFTTHSPTFRPPATQVCVYKGQSYNQGQTWYDGCDYKCTCDDASGGVYRCMKRCPEFFTNVGASNCVNVPDPNDPGCCVVPQCTPTPAPGNTLAPNVVGTIAPGTFIGQPNTTSYVGFCAYKGQTYHQGQVWQDGCDYSCTCKDETTGKYECVDRCPSYGALPPQCQLVADFANPCCQRPDCKFNGNVHEISGTLTPIPPHGTGAPNPNPTQAPKISYCVYKNAQYSQGQTWNDACSYRCRCDDASRGLYVCNDRCPKYENIPPQCVMVTDPTDSCCTQPKCNFGGTPGVITGTLAPNMLPTKVPSIIYGQANTPAPTPGTNGVYPSPQPLNYCSYKGSQYIQGQVWDDGCDYTCRCIDASIGKYQCDEKCTKYAGLPAQCRLIKDAAKPCCFKPVCDFTGTNTQITGQLTTPAPGINPTPAPGINPTLAPNPNPNPNPYPTPGLPKSVCVYRTDVYTQGQQWYDGCNFQCVCEDASKGVYRCSKRCAEYPSVPAGCTMVSDPSDPLCCQVPQCAPQPNNTAPIPTAPPGVISGGSVTLAPQPLTTLAPGVVTQQPPLNPTPAPTPVCVYKGKQYVQGQRWQDGCDYNCECVDAAKGLYNCVEICSKYPNIPPQCMMIRDYNKPCCMVPKCDFTGTHNEVTGQATTLVPHIGPTLAPVPGSQTTQSPTPKAYCSYNGVMFKQGERWDDGCDLKCVCENEMTGYYRCNQRCAQYNNVPAGCTLRTDPKDACCRVPVCTNLPTPAPTPYRPPTPAPGGPTQSPGLNPTLAPNFTPAPNPNPTPYIPTLAPPVVIGQGVTPTPNPSVTLAPGVTPTPVCVYNGKSYTQGQRWDDGCQYNCVCDDAMTGQYKCTERCPVYPQLPASCRLVTSPTDPCCKVPQCTVIPTPAPQPTLAPGVNPTNRPPVGPTLAPNPLLTGAPTQMPTARPQPVAKNGCVMNGKLYTQGQRWNDGCSQVCVCDNSMTGHYTCTERCKAYTAIPKECTMVPDPADPLCCQVPQCIPVPGTNGYPTPSPTDGPIIYTNAPHAVVTGTGTPPTQPPTAAPQPGVVTPAPTPKPKVCVYKGVTYLQDQRWQDGCDYNCICTDGMTGKYTCTQRCGAYPNIPAQCTLQRDPNDYCCYVPVCDWNKQPTPAPNPFSTPQPQPTTYPGQPTPATLAPNPLNTPAPQPRSFCVYNGVTFAQGQSIKDGCSKTCRCDNADMNYYNCFDRCANYPNLGASCYMVTDPNDQCCQIPYCPVMPTPAPNPMSTPVPNPFGTTKAPNLVPGQPTPNPTPMPNPYSTFAPRPYPTGVTGQIINNPDPTRPTSQRGFCIYNGKTYTTGQTWDDGCNYNCVCLDDMTGQYKCTERCPKFPTIPSYCVMVQDPNDLCCKTVSCNGLTPTLAPNMTPAPIPGQNPTLAPNPGQNPTLAPIPGQNPTPAPNPGQNPTPAPNPGQNPTLAPHPGQNPTLAPTFTTQSPFVNPTPAPLPTPAPQPVPKNVCVMNGKAYTQGQRWYDGCKQICVCDNGMTGHYTCNQRCATYNNIQPTCIFVPDPKDPVCCQVPECKTPNSVTNAPVIGTHTGGGPQPTPRPNMTPAPVPGVVTLYPNGPTMYPLPATTLSPNPNPNPNPTLAPTPGPKVCVYKGVTYTQGQKWRDACQYDCTCTDAEHGKYTCNDICPTYPGLPVYCTMVYDPLNPCCQKPDCSTPAPSPNSTPAPGLTYAPTPSPRAQFCVYKGIPLKQGQTFNDGCDKVCRCEDSMTNSVVCDDRCPTYPPLASGCTMTTDPRDQCCQVPYCQPTNPSTNPNQTIITGVPGTITGNTQPNPVPGSVPISGSRSACLYQGKMYTTGQTWDDGCTYHCVCVDDKTGDYQCTERCPRYAKIPAQCTLVQDPNDACCQKPHCDFIAPTPAPNVNPTPAPNVGPTPAPQPGVVTPAPQPGFPTQAPQPGFPTQAPQPGVVTPAPQPVPKTDVCVYGGQMYRQDQVWYDGCNAVCRCENAATGYYRCQERCAQYTSVPATCTMVPDPKDPSCCKVADCPQPPTSVPPTVGYLIPNPSTPAPPKITGIAPVPTQKPTPAPQPGMPTPAPGSPTPAPLPKSGCMYKNHVYAKGQTWDDGCDYVCQCIDDMTGQYSCTKRCADYPNVPPQCVLVQDPKDSCCKVPYCDYINPTPFPNGIPTPAPLPGQTPAPTLAPGIKPTPRPQGYCVYKGVYYTQGQNWNDGCQKKCTCDDVTKGYYSCTDRCPVYNNIPSSCRMVTDANDNCCLAPDCNTFTVSPNQPGPISGQNTGTPIQGGTYPPVTGTSSPIIVAPTYVPAVITGSSNNNPNGVYNNGPTGKNNVCVYKGQIHNQGETWDDGCQYQCTCIDAVRGVYRCAEKCPRYVNLPAYCTYQQDPSNPCCKIAKCDLSLIPTAAPTPMNLFTLNPGTGPVVTGVVTNNPFTGGVVTGSNIPVNPTDFTGVRDKCVYKDNSQHPKGSTWQDGCDYTCVCEEPATNSYRCTARCQVYHDLPSSCYLVADPSDACCKRPQCSGSLVPQTLTGTQPTGPSGSNIVPIGTHSTFSGSGRPNTIPGMSTSGARNVCVYKGTTHNQGQSWDDGCQFTCTCTDASKGNYQCTSKCPSYPTSIPSYCKMNNVPGMCCKSLSCNIPTLGTYQPSPQLVATPAPQPIPGQVPTPSPQVIYPSGTQPVIGGGNQFPGSGTALPPGTSVGSIRNQCVYKNRLYNQGEKWDDGCDYQCECMDAKSGYYRCQPLCAKYTLPQNCYTVQASGQCCEQPVCRRPDGTQFNPLQNPSSLYPVYGSYPTGMGGFRPGYNPSSGSPIVSGQSAVCVYKGKIYTQNQQWDDGCDYTCQCTDAAHGMYTCNEMCSTYTSLPASCHMTQLPGQCCQVPTCDQTPASSIATPHINPTPSMTGCFDAINNCNAYGQTSCQAIFVDWAKQNCNKYCGFCGAQGTSAPQNTGCVDVLNNCNAYGPSSCTGIYAAWARDNCKKTCNLCSTTAAPFITHAPQPSNVNCVDKLPNCADYGSGACSAQYEQWAIDNCPKYCNKCDAIGVYPTGTNGPLPSNNWMIMLKGVAGAPGDLYSLWNGQNTLNENVPQAMYLTAQYPGHYKPDLSNYWNSLCIDKVKVAIYNNGVEKANIIFDATGSDKNSWFRKDKIISSTWTDIKYAPSNLFSLLGDPSMGREFTITSSGGGCNTNGWMVVSTQNNCNFEQGSAKPAFYYAPGQSAINMGQVTPASGDVFTILAHPNCGGNILTNNPPQTTIGTTRACIYKNKIYSQGEKWTDGCDYNCTCENATTGFYRCNNLCPTWNNLPSGCTLQKPAGQCCSEPICGNHTIQDIKDTCYYKNQYYRQGQEWRDGCQYKCTCIDGPSGFYQCKTLCLQWNLPSQCSMDPAPAGKCCQVPNCPSNIIVHVPAGYVQE